MVLLFIEPAIERCVKDSLRISRQYASASSVWVLGSSLFGVACNSASPHAVYKSNLTIEHWYYKLA